MRDRLRNMYYGWWMVVAESVLVSCTYGAWFYAFGTFFTPISQEFGWSRAKTSIAYSFNRGEVSIEGLIAGPLVDKFGPRFMVRVFWTVAAIGFFLMSKINGFLSYILTYVLLVSLGMSGGGQMPMQTIMARWFNKKRGLALGVVLAGAAVLGSLLLQVTARLIVNYGWRMANVYLAIGILMVGWSFSFLLKPHTPEHYGLKMDGERSGTAIAAGQLGTPLAEKNDVRATEGLSRTEALKTQAFWFMVIAFACRQTALAAVTVHEIPLIQDMGVSPILAAAALGTMTLVSSPGRFIGGWMSDRWNQKYLYVVCSVVQAGGLFLLARATSMSWVWAFVITYGFGYGISMSLEPAMRAAFFGGKAYGTIYGSMQFFTVMGAVFGPYFAGWVYDRSHSYTIAFFTFAMLMFVSAVVILFVRNPMLAKQRKSAAPVP